MQPTLPSFNADQRARAPGAAKKTVLICWWVIVAILFFASPLFLLAQDAGAGGRGQGAGPLSWLTPEVITALVGLVGAIFGVWQNRQKKTAEKIRDTLILGIEHGTALAERTGNAEAVKQVVRARAVLAGVEAALAPRVQALTEFSGHEEHVQRVAIEAEIEAEIEKDQPPAPNFPLPPT